MMSLKAAGGPDGAGEGGRHRVRSEDGRLARRWTGCRLLVVLLLLLPGCTRVGDESAESPQPLTAGVWRGDVSPTGGAPFGAEFHVAASDAGVTIRMESQYVRPTFADVVATRDSLRFTWPMKTPRRCLLLPRSDGGWEGACRAGGSDPIGLLLVPPDADATPTGVARAAYETDIAWIEERVGRLRVLVQEGGAAAAHVERVRESASAAFDHAFRLLEETPPEVPFWIFYVDSRADMRRIVGRPAGGLADGVARTAVNTVTSDGRAPDRHEVMHVAATVAWGAPAAPWAWINEGLATYAPGECAGADVHSLAAALVETGEAVPLHRLIHGFWEGDEVSAYLQAASVVGYIREVYGIGAVRAIWQDGPAGFPAAAGDAVAGLEREWLAFVSRLQPATAALEAVRRGGCL